MFCVRPPLVIPCHMLLVSHYLKSYDSTQPPGISVKAGVTTTAGLSSSEFSTALALVWVANYCLSIYQTVSLLYDLPPLDNASPDARCLQDIN